MSFSARTCNFSGRELIKMFAMENRVVKIIINIKYQQSKGGDFMRCKDLKITALDISEYNYEHKAVFRLCSESTCINLEVEKLSDKQTLEEIKKVFSLEEQLEEIKDIIIDKVMEVSKIESRVYEGENCCPEIKDRKVQRGIDSLSTS